MNASSASNGPSQLDFIVNGMTCAACVRRVERKLQKVPGVAVVNVNLATERAHVEFEHEPIPFGVLASCIEDAGYSAKPIPHSVTGQQDHSELERRSAWSRFLLAAALSIPLFVVSMLPMVWAPAMEWMMSWFDMSSWNWILFLWTAPIQFGIGFRFYRLAWKSLAAGSPDMNALVALGTSAAFGYSAVVTVFPEWVPIESRHVYFESSAVVITLVLLGKVLELRARGNAKDSMRALLKLQPSIARIVRGSDVAEIPIQQVNVGDCLEVRPGESFSLDGIVESGSTDANESMVTGEPMTVSKLPGDRVIGGTLNGTGNVRIRVTAIGSETALARIVQFVENAQSSKPPIQSFADSVVAWFVPVILAIALLTWIGWGIVATNGWERGLIHAVTVLIIACPCAMGLAVPASIMVGTGVAARSGVLFKDGQAIESLAEADLFAFDKTGTLTKGRPEWCHTHIFDSYDEEEFLGIVVAVSARSEHPIAKAIVEAASKKHRHAMEILVHAFDAKPGLGSESIVQRAGDARQIKVHVGSFRYMQQLGVETVRAEELASNWAKEGVTTSCVALDGQLVGVLGVRDTLQDDSTEVIQALKGMGKRVCLVSGDNHLAVEFFAKQLHLDHEDCSAEVMPLEKGEIIQRWNQQGWKVAYVGDGINDAPALLSSSVGIAMGTGTDLAMETADVILLAEGIDRVNVARKIAVHIVRNIQQNLFWAFGYNLILIPIAAGLVEAAGGWAMTPVHGAVAMSVSSFLVVMNALRLNRLKL